MQTDQDSPQALTEQAFVALQGRRGLTQEAAQRQQVLKPVTFAEILHYVLGKTDIDIERVAKAINSQLNCRRTYQQLLTQNQVAYAPKAACAQEDELIDLRNGEGFKLKLRSSRARPEQVYVVLEVFYPQQFIAAKPVIMHIVTEQMQQRLNFPPLVDGQSQFILQVEDQRLVALRDINAELYLV
jgi:hypothetical protein